MNKLQCLLCAGQENTIIQKGVRYDADSVVVRCSGCGLVSLSPLPSDQDLSSYYSDQYIAEYEGEVSPERSYKEGLEVSRDRAQRLLPRLRSDSRVLEIGSSAGSFLEALRSHAGTVIGVEPGIQHANWARQQLGVSVVNQLGELDGQSFDVIALFHVLEHFRNPVMYLEELRKYLAPGGTLAVEVPNVNDALLSVYNVPGFPEFYFQRAHLYYFSPETLRRTFELAGARAEIAGVQRYDLSNHLRWMLTGKPGGQSYYRSTIPESVNTAYAEALIGADCADTLWAHAAINEGLDD